MATYLEMLENRGAYPDVMQLTLPNGEVTTFGQAREALQGERQRLAREAQAVHNAKQEIATVYAALDADKVDFERRVSEFEAGKTAGNGRGNGKNDPNERLQKLFDEWDDVKKNIESLKNNELAMAKTYMDQKWEREMKEAGVPEGTTREDLLRLAVKEHLNDANGLPDLGRAIAKINEPKIREKEIKEAEERGRQAALKEQAMVALGHSDLFGSMKTPEGEKPKKYKSIGDALEAAGSDPEILQMLSGATTI